MKFGRFICCVALIGLTVSVAVACENAVRDAAFRGPRDVHRLCLITSYDDKTAQPMSEWIAEWLKGPGSDLNLELVHLRAEDPDVEWEKYGIPSAPPTLPVIALIGKNNGTGEHFVIDHWEPRPEGEEFQTLLHSPVRRRMHKTLGKSLAVVLYAPSKESDEQALHKVFTAVRAKWLTEDLPELEFVKLDRQDPQERVLVSFAGLKPDGPDWVGVVFGRGKLMSPPLVGEEITARRINELVDQIVQDCNCSKPLPAIGVDFPLIWNEELAATFQPVSDPVEKPADPRLAALPGTGGFVTTLESLPPTEASESEPGDVATEPPSEETHDSTNRLVVITLTTLAGVAALMVVASIIVFRKKPT